MCTYQLIIATCLSELRPFYTAFLQKTELRRCETVKYSTIVCEGFRAQHDWSSWIWHNVALALHPYIFVGHSFKLYSVLERGSRDATPFCHWSHSEVGHWCWVKVEALCRIVEPFLYRPHFVRKHTAGISLLTGSSPASYHYVSSTTK